MNGLADSQILTFVRQSDVAIENVPAGRRKGKIAMIARSTTRQGSLASKLAFAMATPSKHFVTALAGGVLLLYGSATSHATPITILGFTCDTSELIDNPDLTSPFGSICPQQSEKARQIGLGPLLSPYLNPYVPPIPYDPYSTTSDTWVDGLGRVVYSPGSYDTFGVNNPSRLGGPVHVSMYGSDGAAGLYTGGDVSSIHSDGFHLSDSAGAVAAQTPGFHALSAGGGVKVTADGTPLIGYSGNQKLLLGLTFDYHHSNMDFGTSALTPGIPSAGSTKEDTYSVIGSANYSINTFYLAADAAFNWTRTGVTDNVNVATGSISGRGYTIGAAVGQLFPLYNTSGVTPAAMPTKAPPPSRSGGYGMFLDVEGGANYRKSWNDGFTESAGFIYGTEQLSYTDLGAKVRLIGIIPMGGFAWMPYIGGSIDRLVGFNHTLNIPDQAAITADTFSFGQSNTFLGAQAGLNILSRGGITADISAFYSASADTKIVGGLASIRIPLWVPQAYADSGIRAAASR